MTIDSWLTALRYLSAITISTVAASFRAKSDCERRCSYGIKAARDMQDLKPSVRDIRSWDIPVVDVYLVARCWTRDYRLSGPTSNRLIPLLLRKASDRAGGHIYAEMINKRERFPLK